MKRAILLSLVLALALLTPSAAHAEALPLVTVVRPANADAPLDEAITRLSAELRAEGFEVHVVTTEGVPAEARAVATLTLTPTAHGTRVALRVADRLRHLDAGDTGADTAAGDLAIRSVELLRASLAELHARPDPGASVTSGPRAPPAKAAPPTGAGPPRRAPATPIAGTMEAGVALLAGSFGVAPTPLLRLAAGRGAGLSLGLTLAPAPGATTLLASAGSLSLRQTLGFLDVAWSFQPEGALLHPRLSLGAGIYQLRVTGHAAPPYRSERRDLLAAAFVAGAGLGLRLGAGLTVIAELEALALTPRPVVAVLDREVARAGFVTFLPSLGLASRF